MTVRLGWRVFFNTRGEAKAQKLLRQVEKCLGLPLNVTMMGPCDECDRHYEALFTTDLEVVGEDLRVVFYEVAQRVNRLAGRWELDIPHLYPNSECQFSGAYSSETSTGSSVTGLVWASFDIYECGVDLPPYVPSDR